MALFLPAELVQTLAHFSVLVAAPAAEIAQGTVIQRILGDFRVVQNPLALGLQFPVPCPNLTDGLTRIASLVKARGHDGGGSPSKLPVDLAQTGKSGIGLRQVFSGLGFLFPVVRLQTLPGAGQNFARIAHFIPPAPRASG